MPATPPVVTAISYDKTGYAPGDKITATVTYAPGTSVIDFTGTGTVTDTSTGQSGTGTADFQVTEADATKAASFTDNGGHTWALVSDVSGVATWQATA